MKLNYFKIVIDVYQMGNKLILICGYSFSGKTTIIGILKALGYDTFICDEFIKHIYKAGEIGYNIIKKNFGTEFVNRQEVDKSKLRRLVFSKPIYLNKLNDLIQPLILQQIKKIRQNHEGMIFVELKTAIDYPKYYKNLFQQAWIVKCSNEIIKKRIENKKLHPENKAFEIINYEGYYKKARIMFRNARIIYNDESKMVLERRIRELLNVQLMTQ